MHIIRKAEPAGKMNEQGAKRGGGGGGLVQRGQEWIVDVNLGSETE